MINQSNDSFSVLGDAAYIVAPKLLGSLLERTIDGHLLRVRIVEVEAYDESDAASHSYRGSTPRTAIMFGPFGFLYVYFTYGMHYCCNIVTGPVDSGAAVLLRAAEPLVGMEYMSERRHGLEGKSITNGPAKLCQALGIDKQLNGHDLHGEPLRLILRDPLPQSQIVQTTRIGITQAVEVPWRFYIRDNPFVSKAVG